MENNKSISINKNSVNVIVDYRIELLSIVEFLAGYNIILTKLDFDYKNKVIEYFSDYKEHDVIKLFLELNKIGFTFGTPPTITLYMNEDFQIRNDVIIDDFYVNRMGGKQKLVQFSKLLQEFSQDTHFYDFFLANKSYYEEIIHNTIDIFEQHNFILEVHSYYGMQKNSYNIVLVSLFAACGFGPNVEYINGLNDIYSIIGPLECNRIPVFGSAQYFKYMQRHEFSHSFINPLTLKHWTKAKKYIALYDATKGIKQNCYGDWEECINEHIIRAIVIRLSSLSKEGTEDELLKLEFKRGFIYIEDIIQKLKYYEQNRHEYINFDSYYVKLLECLEKYL